MRGMSLVACAAAVAFASTAGAQVRGLAPIEFDDLPGPDGAPVPTDYREGDHWRINEFGSNPGMVQNLVDGDPTAPCITQINAQASFDVSRLDFDTPNFFFTALFFRLDHQAILNERIVLEGFRNGVVLWTQTQNLEDATPGQWLQLRGTNGPPQPEDEWVIDHLRVTGIFEPLSTHRTDYDFISVVPIPAPGALALFTGAGLLAIRRRR